MAMNSDKKRYAIFGGSAAVLILAAGIVYFLNREDNSIPEVTNGIYYTGPMKSKGGSDVYGTLDGRSLNAEDGKAAAAEWLKQHPELNKGGPGPAPSSSNVQGSKAEVK